MFPLHEARARGWKEGLHITQSSGRPAAGLTIESSTPARYGEARDALDNFLSAPGSELRPRIEAGLWSCLASLEAQAPLPASRLKAKRKRDKAAAAAKVGEQAPGSEAANKPKKDRSPATAPSQQPRPAPGFAPPRASPGFSPGKAPAAGPLPPPAVGFRVVEPGAVKPERGGAEGKLAQKRTKKCEEETRGGEGTGEQLEERVPKKKKKREKEKKEEEERGTADKVGRKRERVREAEPTGVAAAGMSHGGPAGDTAVSPAVFQLQVAKAALKAAKKAARAEKAARAAETEPPTAGGGMGGATGSSMAAGGETERRARKAERKAAKKAAQERAQPAVQQ